MTTNELREAAQRALQQHIETLPAPAKRTIRESMGRNESMTADAFLAGYAAALTATTNEAAGQWLPIETAPTERGAKFIGLTKSGRAITAVPSYGVYDAGPVFRGWDEEERGSFVSADLVCWMPFPGEIAASPATAGERKPVGQCLVPEYYTPWERTTHSIAGKTDGATTNEAAAQAENYESAKDEARSIAMQFGLCGELVQSGLQCEKLAKLIAHVRATQPVQAQGEAAADLYYALSALHCAATMVAIKDNSDRNPEAVRLRECLSQAEALLEAGCPAVPAVDRGLSEDEEHALFRAAFPNVALYRSVAPMVAAWEAWTKRAALAASAPSQAEPDMAALREQLAKAFAARIPALADSHSWRGWPGLYSFANVAISVLLDRAPASEAPGQAEPAEIDYDKLVRDAWANHKYRQGTGACTAFKHGAEWQAAQAAPSQAGSCQASGEAAPASVGWTSIDVKPGFSSLMDSIERACRKGYAPDDVQEAWNAWGGWRVPEVAQPAGRTLTEPKPTLYVRCIDGTYREAESHEL